MKQQIKKAILSTLVIENKESIDIAVDKIIDINRDLLRNFLMWYEEPSITDISATDGHVDNYLKSQKKDQSDLYK